MVFYLLYESTAADGFGLDDLPGLLRQSTVHNARAGLTGLLVYRGRRFMQYLEGDEDEVRSLMRRIEADPRHHDVATLVSGTAGDRAFARWSMGFVDLEAVADAPGYRSFVETALDGAAFGADHGDVQDRLRRFGVALP